MTVQPQTIQREIIARLLARDMRLFTAIVATGLIDYVLTDQQWLDLTKEMDEWFPVLKDVRMRNR